MKVEIYSREAMEKRLQEGKLYDTAVICFYDPPSSRTPADYAPINYDKKCSAEYSIAVHDIDIEVLSEYGLHMTHTFLKRNCWHFISKPPWNAIWILCVSASMAKAAVLPVPPQLRNTTITMAFPFLLTTDTIPIS